MKRSVIQVSIGLLPILLGFGSRVLFLLPLPFFLINLLLLSLWIWLCFRSCDPGRSVLTQFLRVCVPGAVITALAICQELIPGNNLPGFLISASQFYYLSGLALTGRILAPFLRSISASPYILTDCLVLTIFCLLCMVLKKKVA